MTVKQAFEKAFGYPLDETVGCHSAYGDLNNNYLKPCISGYDGVVFVPVWSGNGDVYNWVQCPSAQYAKTPDISERPFEAFRGYFGKEYDDVIDEFYTQRKAKSTQPADTGDLGGGK